MSRQRAPPMPLFLRSASPAAVALFEHPFKFALQISDLFPNFLNFLFASFPLGLLSLLPLRFHGDNFAEIFRPTTLLLKEFPGSVLLTRIVGPGWVLSGVSLIALFR